MLMNNERFAFRIPDACIALGIGRTHLYALIRKGNLRVIRLGGRTLVPLSEIVRLTSVAD